MIFPKTLHSPGDRKKMCSTMPLATLASIKSPTRCRQYDMLYFAVPVDFLPDHIFTLHGEY
jgi:hypothetical protein